MRARIRGRDRDAAKHGASTGMRSGRQLLGRRTGFFLGFEAGNTCSRTRRMDLLAEPVEHVVVDPDGNSRLARGRRDHRAALSLAEVGVLLHRLMIDGIGEIDAVRRKMGRRLLPIPLHHSRECMHRGTYASTEKHSSFSSQISPARNPINTSFVLSGASSGMKCPDNAPRVRRSGKWWANESAYGFPLGM